MMTWDFFFRLLVAGVLGAIIGLDREYRAKEAGFRTHFLVALGSALFMIVSKYGFWDILGNTGIGLDPSRIAAQVVSGIGFLGAGTIIIQKLFVRGLTTAAGIWATSAIGLAVGAGQYWLGISAMLLTLLGLEGLGYIFQKISQEVIKEVTDEIKRKKHSISSYSTESSKLGDMTTYRVTMVIRTHKTGDETLLFQFIQHLPDVMIDRME